jgi:hypothetical protein
MIGFGCDFTWRVRSVGFGLLVCVRHGRPYLYAALWRMRLVVGWCQ